MSCGTTHYKGCECNERAHAREIADLEAEVARLRVAAQAVVTVYWHFDKSMRIEIEALQALLNQSPVQHMPGEEP